MLNNYKTTGTDGAGFDADKKNTFHSGFFYMIEPPWTAYLQYKYGRFTEALLCKMYDCLGSMANFRRVEIKGKLQRSRVKVEDGEELWTSLRAIWQKTGMAPNTVRKYLLILQDEGLITAEITPGKGVRIGFTCPIPAPPGDFRGKKKQKSRKKQELLGDIAVLQANHNISNDFIQSYIKENFRRNVELKNMGIAGLQKILNWIRDCANDGCTVPRSNVDSERNPFKVCNESI